MSQVRNFAVAICLASAVFSTQAIAENLKFDIENSSDYTISSFQSNEGDGWSDNWLGGNEVGPGEAMTLEFVKDGPCDIEVRVGWRTTDGGQEMGEPWQINICDAHTVYFDGEQVTYD